MRSKISLGVTRKTDMPPEITKQLLKLTHQLRVGESRIFVKFVKDGKLAGTIRLKRLSSVWLSLFDEREYLITMEPLNDLQLFTTWFALGDYFEHFINWLLDGMYYSIIAEV